MTPATNRGEEHISVRAVAFVKKILKPPTPSVSFTPQARLESHFLAYLMHQVLSHDLSPATPGFLN